MSLGLSAGPPLVPHAQPVGHRSGTLVDATRADRALPVDWWYPAGPGSEQPSIYELLPGIGFTASAGADAPLAPGPHPLVVWSHGRSGTRSSYVMLCEGLAARGYVVVAADHPGDTLLDWMTGTAVDDATNEAQRVDDVRFVLDEVLGGASEFAGKLDASRIAVAGHSYGAWTAYAYAGVEPRDHRVRAVAGLQPFTRSLPRRVLGGIAAPALLIAGAKDETTPPEIDADRAFDAMRDALRVDVEAAGHQACSDVGLYLELAPQVEGVPELVLQFVSAMANQVTGRAGDPWRPTVGLHLQTLAAWLDDVLDRDRERANADLVEVAGTPGVNVRRTIPA